MCKKVFTTKQRQIKHEQKCPERTSEVENTFRVLLKEKDKHIAELKKQVSDLQNKLAHVAEVGAKKDTVRIKNMNNIVNNMVPYDLTKPMVDQIVDSHFTKVDLYDQANGVATFAATKLLKDSEGKVKMMCTDSARRVFVYKDAEGNLYRDVNANGFLELYMPAVTRKSYDLMSTAETTSDMMDMMECMKNIEPVSVSAKLASKLVPKPSNL
jgi:hypothetical protein